MVNDFNGLASTPRRRALVALIARRDGKVRHVHDRQQVIDGNTGTVVTDVVRQMLAADWLRVIPPEQRNQHEQEQGATYYQVTEIGEKARAYR